MRRTEGPRFYSGRRHKIKHKEVKWRHHPRSRRTLNFRCICFSDNAT